MSKDQEETRTKEPINRDDEIARIAYRLYEEEGRPEGRDQDHWHRAEQEFHGPIPPWTAESGAGDA